jgi:hypothetical protein
VTKTLAQSEISGDWSKLRDGRAASEAASIASDTRDHEATFETRMPFRDLTRAERRDIGAAFVALSVVFSFHLSASLESRSLELAHRWAVVCALIVVLMTVRASFDD